MNRIEKQYQTAQNLNTRISIHEKYSVNKQPFGEWIVSHYEIGPEYQILELGCGTGSMWADKLDWLHDGAHLTLTDFSAGMIEIAQKNVGNHPQVDYRVVDIQSIPFEDDFFDMVIANMMLYHVPDLHKGLCEVRRVLKPEGKFYCATYGEHGVMEFVNDVLREYGISGEIGTTFTLQNGRETLHRHFSDVQRFHREDGLAVKRIDDFVDYVLSLSGLTGVSPSSRGILRQAFESKTKDGILYVPKEYGMFICK